MTRVHVDVSLRNIAFQTVTGHLIADVEGEGDNLTYTIAKLTLHKGAAKDVDLTNGFNKAAIFNALAPELLAERVKLEQAE